MPQTTLSSCAPHIAGLAPWTSSASEGAKPRFGAIARLIGRAKCHARSACKTAHPFRLLKGDTGSGQKKAALAARKIDKHLQQTLDAVSSQRSPEAPAVDASVHLRKLRRHLETQGKLTGERTALPALLSRALVERHAAQGTQSVRLTNASPPMRAAAGQDPLKDLAGRERVLQATIDDVLALCDVYSRDADPAPDSLLPVLMRLSVTAKKLQWAGADRQKDFFAPVLALVLAKEQNGSAPQGGLAGLMRALRGVHNAALQSRVCQDDVVSGWLARQWQGMVEAGRANGATLTLNAQRSAPAAEGEARAATNADRDILIVTNDLRHILQGLQSSGERAIRDQLKADIAPLSRQLRPELFRHCRTLYQSAVEWRQNGAYAAHPHEILRQQPAAAVRHIVDEAAWLARESGGVDWDDYDEEWLEYDTALAPLLKSMTETLSPLDRHIMRALDRCGASQFLSVDELDAWRGDLMREAQRQSGLSAELDKLAAMPESGIADIDRAAAKGTRKTQRFESREHDLHPYLATRLRTAHKRAGAHMIGMLEAASSKKSKDVKQHIAGKTADLLAGRQFLNKYGLHGANSWREAVYDQVKSMSPTRLAALLNGSLYDHVSKRDDMLAGMRDEKAKGEAQAALDEAWFAFKAAYIGQTASKVLKDWSKAISSPARELSDARLLEFMDRADEGIRKSADEIIPEDALLRAALRPLSDTELAALVDAGLRPSDQGAENRRASSAWERVDASAQAHPNDKIVARYTEQRKRFCGNLAIALRQEITDRARIHAGRLAGDFGAQLFREIEAVYRQCDNAPAREINGLPADLAGKLLQACVAEGVPPPDLHPQAWYAADGFGQPGGTPIFVRTESRLKPAHEIAEGMRGCFLALDRDNLSEMLDRLNLHGLVEQGLLDRGEAETLKADLVKHVLDRSGIEGRIRNLSKKLPNIDSPARAPVLSGGNSAGAAPRLSAASIPSQTAPRLSASDWSAEPESSHASSQYSSAETASVSSAGELYAELEVPLTVPLAEDVPALPANGGAGTDRAPEGAAQPAEAPPVPAAPPPEPPAIRTIDGHRTWPLEAQPARVAQTADHIAADDSGYSSNENEYEAATSLDRTGDPQRKSLRARNRAHTASKPSAAAEQAAHRQSAAAQLDEDAQAPQEPAARQAQPDLQSQLMAEISRRRAAIRQSLS